MRLYIWGGEFLASFIWKRKAGGGDDSNHVAAEHEYVVCYAGNSEVVELASIEHESPSMTAKYNRSENGRRYYLERLDKTSLTYSDSMDFPIEAPDGSMIEPPQPDPINPTTAWRWSKKTVNERRDELEFLQEKKTNEWRVYTRTWESLDGVTPRSLLVEKGHGRNRDGTEELTKLIGPKVFNNPKPTRFLSHLIKIGAPSEGDVLLDFFAGSASFAHAVQVVSIDDNKVRKCISVQLPEKTNREDYLNIAQIARARLKKLDEIRAGNQKNASVTGFRAFQLTPSTFAKWEATTEDTVEDLQYKLEQHAQHLDTDASDEDILFELLLKDGYELTTKVKRLDIPGGTVHSIADGALLICLERSLTRAMIDALADLADANDVARVVCLDAGFESNDELKTNAVQTFKSRMGEGADPHLFRTV